MSQPPDQAGSWPDLAGRLIEDAGGRRHVLPIRVYFEDTDFSGLVYHATYLRWCERGRSDFLRLMGNDHQALIAGASGREPAAFVVRRMHLEYLKPARIDEVLAVATRAKESTAATLVLDQRVSRAGVELFTAEVMVVLISASGKPMRLSTALREALQPKPACAYSTCNPGIRDSEYAGPRSDNILGSGSRLFALRAPAGMTGGARGEPHADA